MGGVVILFVNLQPQKRPKFFKNAGKIFYLLAGSAYFYFYFSKLFAKNMPIGKKNGMQNNLKLLFFKT